MRKRTQTWELLQFEVNLPSACLVVLCAFNQIIHENEYVFVVSFEKMRQESGESWSVYVRKGS